MMIMKLITMIGVTRSITTPPPALTKNVNHKEEQHERSSP
jgi:hypothetical protein